MKMDFVDIVIGECAPYHYKVSASINDNALLVAIDDDDRLCQVPGPVVCPGGHFRTHPN